VWSGLVSLQRHKRVGLLLKTQCAQQNNDPFSRCVALGLQFVISEHFMITFEYTLLDYTASEKKFTNRRCLSENAVTKFKS